MTVPELVVVQFDVVPPYATATQGGHYRDEKDPSRSLCGKLIIDKKTTIMHCKCTACFLASGAKVHDRRRHVGTTIPTA